MMNIDQMWEGERAKFEAEIVKMNDDPAMLERWPGGAYKHHGVDGRWSGWKMACRASRPAEVDDEGLPPLPDQYVELSPFPGRKYFTAEQYRQGQRDAVAADRAKEWFVVGGRRVGRTYMAKLAHDAARYRWLRESSNVEAASILDMHSGDSMDARVDQAMALAAAQPAAK